MNIYISTWFYESPKGENVYYPGVGDKSDTWDFQKIYWNCIYSFFKTARQHCKSADNINFKFLLFLNGDIPNKGLYGNGFEPEKFFSDNDVDLIKFDPKHIPSDDGLKTFRTQFVMIDILKKMQFLMNPDDLFLILDSDCIFVKPIPVESFDDLAVRGIQFIPNSWSESDVSNGLNNRQFNEIGEKLSPEIHKKINYFCGGEYFGFSFDKLVEFNKRVEDLYAANFCLDFQLQTEEQLFTLCLNLMRDRDFSDASKFIRRVWTDAEKFRNAQECDDCLSVLHLPAEKNKGFYKFSEEYIFGENNKQNHFNYADLKIMFNLA